jgi:glycerol uptake facilitator-like aquaporin
MNKRQIAALLAEFVGTFTLVLVVLNVSRYGLPLFTALAAGVSVAVFVSAFSKVSGGHFNPIVTFGLFAIRQVSVLRTIGYLAAQALAAVAAWKLYEYFTERTLTNATTELDWRILTAEAVGGLIFGIAVAAVVTQKIEGYQAAYTVGAGLFLGLTVAGLASNAIVNPAVALGIRSFDINYLVGPIVGGILGMLLVAYLIVPIFGVGKTKVTAAASSAPAPAKPAVKAKKAPAKKTAAKKSTTKKTTKK